MPKDIRTILFTNDTDELNRCHPETLLNFHSSIYNNILLYAARYASTEAFKIVLKRIESAYGKEKRNELCLADDSLDRGILVLATIADNPSLLEYLHKTLRFKINYRDKDGYSAMTFSIERNRRRSFVYLLQNGAEFTKKEQSVLASSQKEGFKEYFNTPSNFLMVVMAGNTEAFMVLMRHIKTIAADEQKKFILAKDVHDRNALILACNLNRSERIIRGLLELEFNVLSTDDAHHTAAYYLIQHQRFNLAPELIYREEKLLEEEITALQEKMDQTTFDGKDERKHWGQALTSSPHHCRQQGRISKLSTEEIKRPYRSFSSERERQLLRQIATQLYFYLKNQDNIPGKLVEVQIMHLAIGNRHNVFIALNEHPVSRIFQTFIDEKISFKRILTKIYDPDGLEREEGRIRSVRYAKKLSFRLFGETIQLPDSKDPQDQIRINHIAEIMRLGQFEIIPVTSNLEKNKETFHLKLTQSNKIYLLVSGNLSIRDRFKHAEEFLCDIAEEAIEFSKLNQEEIHTCIGGKKRPCMTCSGRMSHRIDSYGKHPGRWWQDVFIHQPNEAAKETLKLLCQEKSSVTLGKNNRPTAHFDSGSDSDDESTLLKYFLMDEPWSAFIEEGWVSQQTLAHIPLKELSAFEKSGDIEALHEEYSFQILFQLFREDPFHITCLEAILHASGGALTDLVIDEAPNIPPILMDYAVENDVDWDDVLDALGDSDRQQLKLLLSNYFQQESPSDDESLGYDMSQLSL